jgi:hypothetical protein
LLGFSIASFTILLSVGDEKFRRLLGVVRPGKQNSTLVRSASAFFHFILLQAIVLLTALVASARPFSAASLATGFVIEHQSQVAQAILVGLSKAFRGLGMLLLLYTLMSAVAAMLNVFRITQLFSEFVSQKPRQAPGVTSPPDEKQ